MEKSQFWRLIEDAKQAADGDCEDQVTILGQKLRTLPPEEIISFDRILDEFRDLAYRWDLWGAAYIINGGCSDDGFEYFRCWLIAQGETIYTSAVQNPDSLADVIDADDSDLECEALLYIAGDVYRKKTGQEPPMTVWPPQFSDAGEIISREPLGVRWREEDLDTLCPKIAMKIGEAVE